MLQEEEGGHDRVRKKKDTLLKIQPQTRCIGLCQEFFFYMGLGFELRALHLQSRHSSACILLWLFWRCGLTNYFPGLALNHDLLNLSLPIS
jgi:hypothetical protein